MDSFDKKGWVKNHRAIENWKYYKKDGYAHLWQHLIRNVHHSDTPTCDGYGNKIFKGQLSTGRMRLERETGLSASKCDRILKRLEIAHQITRETTNKCSIITIVKWEEYQDLTQDVSIKRTSSEHQVNINRTQNKNGKNGKNKKAESPSRPEKPVDSQGLTNAIGNILKTI